MLRHVPAVSDPRVLVDAATRDDAAVFQVAPDRALVATVDFFTPIVDDPEAFGRIAAANALSDIYAMGARPLFALNLVAWPRDPDVLPLLGPVLAGAAALAREAGCLVLGGHSIDDPEPKFGMMVIGEARPEDIITNAGAQPGDRLVLTKPLGTGILATALKRDLLTERDLAEAVRWMTTLNAGGAEAMREVAAHVHAATDVTGFGLLGHLHSLLEASDVAATITADVPTMGGVYRAIVQGAVPGGTTRNLASAGAWTAFPDTLGDARRIVLADAQTSGGLLIAVGAEGLAILEGALASRNVPAHVIGSVHAGPPGHITVSESP